MSQIIYPIIISSVIGKVYALEVIPVFIVDDGLLNGKVESQQDPFVKTSQEELETIVDISQKLADTLLFFIEERFSFEDVSSKDKGGTPFYYLRKAFLEGKVKMFPRVVNPYNYFTNRFQPFEFNTFHVQSTTTKLRLEGSYKFMYFYFEDGTNETRVQKLRRHDAILQEVFIAVKQLTKGPVIAFYTGKFNPVKIPHDTRMARPSDKTPPDNTLVVHCGNATFQFINAVVTTMDEKHHPLKILYCEQVPITDDLWMHQFTFEFKDTDTSTHPSQYELQYFFTYFNVNKKEDGWKLIKITYLSEKGELKTFLADIHSEWDTFYESPLPLVIQPGPSFPYEPIISIRVQRISLSANEHVPSTTKYTKPVGILNGATESALRIGYSENHKGADKTKSGNESKDDKKAQKLADEDPEGTKSAHKDTLRVDTDSEDNNQQNNNEQNNNEQNNNQQNNNQQNNNQHNNNQQNNNHQNNNQQDKNKKIKSKLDEEIFVTIEIATGLFVVTILLPILFFGIQMMMNIRANSIYDSPDQKPLFNPDMMTD